MRSNIGAAILAALAMSAMPNINNINVPGESLFRREHSRSRAGTRSNLRYVHKAVDITHMVPTNYEWETSNDHGLVAETRTHCNVPMRRAERKGVPGVPRGHGDKSAIRF